MITAHCVIIGAMKCATTSVFDALALHPMIAAAREKEPAFFCRPTLAADDFVGYDALHDFDPDIHAYALEASTAYTKAPLTDPTATAAAMLSSGRRFRFIYLVRDPIERIASHIRNQIDYGIVTPEDRFRHLTMIQHFSRYGEQLDRFRAGWPACDLAVFDYDDVTNPDSTVFGRMVDWLGLPPCAAVRVPHSNRSRTPLQTASILSPGQQSHLRKVLAPDLLRFGRDWGIDVAKWGFQ